MSNIDDDFEHITTNDAVIVYETSTPIFDGILYEIRELSKKKAEATMSISKVKIINQVLIDLLEILQDEPMGKYLQKLDEDSLPQISDAVLTMVQFRTALTAFKHRYYIYLSDLSDHYWITKENIKSWIG